MENTNVPISHSHDISLIRKGTNMTETKRLHQIIRDIHLAIDDTESLMNTHSQDQCNDALSLFFDRVKRILYTIL